MVKIIGCPECKRYSLELIDPTFIWYGQIFQKYVCSECFYEVIR